MKQVFQNKILTSIKNPHKRLTESEFNEAALNSFYYQLQYNRPYAKYCRLYGILNPSHWSEITPLPVSAYKEVLISSAQINRKPKVLFKTSGTTGLKSGLHLLYDTDYYNAAIDRLNNDYLTGKLKFIYGLNLVGSLLQMPHSSLAYMAERILKKIPKKKVIKPGDLPGQFKSFARFLGGCRQRVIIFATTFALADFCEFLKENNLSFRLPKGSLILETGGYKGRRKELSQKLFRQLVQSVFPGTRLINEYGMCELTSHFYDVAPGIKETPSWCRVASVNPATGRLNIKGGRGYLRILDLANQNSCIMIQTEDIGTVKGRRFTVAGRSKLSTPRGCSLLFEDGYEKP